MVSQAVKDLDLCLRVTPQDETLLADLCFMLTFHGRLIEGIDVKARAKDAVDRLLAVVPTSPEHYRYPVFYHRNYGDIEDAIRVGLEAHKRHPESFEIARTLAYTYQKSGQLEEAIAFYGKAIQYRSGRLTPAPYAKRGECLLQLGEIEAARKDYEAALNSGKRTEWISIEWDGVIDGFRSLKDWETVESLFRERLEIHAEQLGGESLVTLSDQFELAEFLEQQKRTSEAEDLYRDVFETNRRIRGDDDDLTIRCIESLNDTYIRRGDTRARRKDFERAAMDFSRAIDLLPPQPNHFAPARRKAYWAAMRWDEVYEKLVSMRPDDKDLPFERALFLASKGQFEAAMESARQGEYLPNKLGRRQFHVGMLLILSESFEEYQQFCQDVVTTRSADDGNWIKLGFNLLAVALAASPESGLDAETFQRIGDSVWQRSESTHFACQAGICSLRAGRYEEALERLTHAWELSERTGSKGSVCFPLAMTHHHLGNSDESREWYDRGIKYLRGVPPSAPPDAGTPPNFWLLWNVQYREATALLGLSFDQKLLDPANTTEEESAIATKPESDTYEETNTEPEDSTPP